MLLVQKYLETKTFGQLASEHGVYASFSKSGHKFSLNYDQIEAKESDPLAQECRGLILSLEDGSTILETPNVLKKPMLGTTNTSVKINHDHICPSKTKILAYPMNRFFNHGQGSAAQIDFNDSTLKVLEKLDGTLCIVYFDPFATKWCVATRAVSEADLNMDSGLFTFRTLFEKALEETTGLNFDVVTNEFAKNYTYCFELTTPYNRIVVDYRTCGITLLAARDMDTLKEVDPNSITFKHNIPKVREFSFTNVSDIVDWVSNQNPIEYEGVVVRDKDFNRLKLKNAAYTAFNRARDILGASDRNCLELILAEKDDDVLQVLPPEIVKNLLKIKSNIKDVLNRYDMAYQLIKNEADKINPGDKKTFAKLVVANPSLWHAPFFQIFDGKASGMKDFIAKNRKDGTWANSFLDKLLEISIRATLA